MTTDAPHEGQIVRLADGNDYVVPPITFGQLKRLGADIAALSGLAPADYGSDAALERVARIAHAALSRNYPDLAPETVLDLLDFGNVARFMSAIYAQNGFRAVRDLPAGQEASP